MKLIIDIPEEMYNDANILIVKDFPEIKKAIVNGTPLPKHHGKIVDIGRLDDDRMESDNPIIYLTANGEYTEAVSLDYLNDLPAIIPSNKEAKYKE